MQTGMPMKTSENGGGVELLFAEVDNHLLADTVPRTWLVLDSASTFVL